MNVAWVTIRVQGGADTEPQTFPSVEAQDKIASADAQCPSCWNLIQRGDELAAVPLGPGATEKSRAEQRRNEWYSAVAVIVHRACLGVESEASMSTRIGGAADTLREVADEMDRRTKERAAATDGDPELIPPCEPLREASAMLTRMSRDTARFEEVLL